MVEHLTFNERVDGSSPSSLNFLTIIHFIHEAFHMSSIYSYTPSFCSRLEELCESFDCPISLDRMEEPIALVPCLHNMDLDSYKTLSTDSCPLCRQTIRSYFQDSLFRDLGGNIKKIEDCVKERRPLSEMQDFLSRSLQRLTCQASGSFFTEAVVKDCHDGIYTRFNASHVKFEESDTEGSILIDHPVREITKKTIYLHQYVISLLLSTAPDAPFYFSQIAQYLKQKDVARAIGGVCKLWSRIQRSEAFAFWQQTGNDFIKIYHTPTYISIYPVASFKYSFGSLDKYSKTFHEFRIGFKCVTKKSLFDEIYISRKSGAITVFLKAVNIDATLKYLKQYDLIKWFTQSNDTSLYCLDKYGQLPINFDKVPLEVFYKVFRDNRLPVHFANKVHNQILKRQRELG